MKPPPSHPALKSWVASTQCHQRYRMFRGFLLISFILFLSTLVIFSKIICFHFLQVFILRAITRWWSMDAMSSATAPCQTLCLLRLQVSSPPPSFPLIPWHAPFFALYLARKVGSLAGRWCTWIERRPGTVVCESDCKFYIQENVYYYSAILWVLDLLNSWKQMARNINLFTYLLIHNLTSLRFYCMDSRPLQWSWSYSEKNWFTRFDKWRQSWDEPQNNCGFHLDQIF